MKKTEIEKEKALAALFDNFKLRPGDVIYTKLNHVSMSGMMRVIDLFVIRDNKPLRLSWSVASATGLKYDRGWEGVRIGGCGQDMGFAIVYALGRVMFPDGFGCAGPGKCRSNDHSNGDRDYTKGKKHWHRDGGYAFEHRWM